MDDGSWYGELITPDPNNYTTFIELVFLFRLHHKFLLFQSQKDKLSPSLTWTVCCCFAEFSSASCECERL